jgi:transposase
LWSFCDSLPDIESAKGVKMVALALSETHSAERLRALARSEKRPKVRTRLLAMACLLEGRGREETARQFGMSRNVLRIWVGRYNAAGPDGLADLYHLEGRPVRLDAAQCARLKTLVEAGADHDRDGIVAYRVLDICDLAKREFTVEYSVSGMTRLLHAIGCSWLVPRPEHPQGDPAAREEFKKNSRKSSMR